MNDKWVVDIVNLPDSRQTDADRAKVGKHHADALIARLCRDNVLPLREHACYIGCCIAGFREQWRQESEPGVWRGNDAYWSALIDKLIVYRQLEMLVYPHEQEWRRHG